MGLAMVTPLLVSMTFLGMFVSCRLTVARTTLVGTLICLFAPSRWLPGRLVARFSMIVLFLVVRGVVPATSWILVPIVRLRLRCEVVTSLRLW